MSNLTIHTIETTIVDLPVKRVHELSGSSLRQQSYLLIRIVTDAAIIGIGEVSTPGGPWWSGDSIESSKIMIDQYFTPALIGADPFRIHFLLDQLNRIAVNNAFPKAGIEMALYDIIGKALNVPVYELLGGRYRESIPMTWALGSGSLDQDIAEAKEKLATKFCSRFKIKMGQMEPRDDTARVAKLAEALADKAYLQIDLNAEWDEHEAMAYLPVLQEAGIKLIEQPISRHNIAGMKRLAQQLSIPIMADESLITLQDAQMLADGEAPFIFALKLMKSGGIDNSRKIAAIGEAAGLNCYGGSFLESSIGAAANIHLGASLSTLKHGCEWLGPEWLADEVVQTPVTYRDNHICIPDGPGLGIALDTDKVKHYRRT